MWVGAFGIVYKAVHKATSELRAIKFIDRSAVSQEFTTNLLQEIDILKKLVCPLPHLQFHPHIVQLYEFYSDSKYYYLVTE
jgi:calcium-dependent protein kinase